MKKYFLLFSNCIPVKGARRSTICDFQKNTYVFIPNILFDILCTLEKVPIEKFLNENKNISKRELKKYLDYLIYFDLGHFTDKTFNFPKINDSFNTPYAIQDCIIELSPITASNFKFISQSLTKLGCQTLELRAYNFFSINRLIELLEYLKYSRIRNVEIYIKHSYNIQTSTYKNLVSNYPVIGLLVLHSCPKGEEKNEGRIFYTHDRIDSSSCCGKISPKLFNINLSFYLEGKRHNTCLHRKVSIDADGNIKNCPSIKANFGNIKLNSLEKAIERKGFKDLWNINKDKISTCKDCEFRYICSDCRAYLNSKFDKPLNCRYNPYTMEYEKIN